MTELFNFWGDQHAWPLDLTIGTIWRDIHCTYNMHACILVGLIPCPLKDAKNTAETWHFPVETMLSPLWQLDINVPGSKCNCADGFQRQCYPLLAAWVGDCQEQVMVAEVSYGLSLICEILKGAPMWHWIFQPLDNSRGQHVHLELKNESNIDVLHTLGVCLIQNQFWLYPLCNVYQLWQPDALHQLLLGLFKDLMYWVLK